MDNHFFDFKDHVLRQRNPNELNDGLNSAICGEESLSASVAMRMQSIQLCELYRDSDNPALSGSWM
jgi:hypothetical protein